MNNVSPQEIRKRYFGTDQLRSPLTPNTPHENDLTPSAKYVLREAKTRLGAHTANAVETAPSEDDLLQVVTSVEEVEGEELSAKERNAVVAALSSSLDHYDILTSLVENSDVNDIIVRCFNDISIQIGRKNIQTDLRFADQSAYKSFVENLLKRAGKSCTVATPVVDAAVDRNIRACVTHESFSPPGSGPMLTLRISRHKHISADALVQLELAPRIVMDYLTALVQEGSCSLLIAGEVGTGKTTLVRALTQRVNDDEAVLIIEDTHELVLERRFVRTLLTREANTEGAGRISPAQAIRTGMRLAMNRVVLGEMRDGEAAEAFVDVCSSGHAGMSTIHARSARDALSRLELFLSRAQGMVPIETIRRQIANAVSLVVYLGVDKNEKKRRVIEVVELCSGGDGIIQLAPIFLYASHESFAHGSSSLGSSVNGSYRSETGPIWKRGAGISRFEEVLARYNVMLPTNETTLSLDPEEVYRSLHQNQQ